MATDAMNSTELSLLSQRIADLEQEVGRLQDESQIRKLQYTYGYFIDKSQYNEVVDLFAEDGEVWFLGGIYKGKAGVRRLYIERFQTQFTQGHNGPRYGWLLDHPQLQMVIDVAPDRQSAQGARPLDDAGRPARDRRGPAARLVGRRHLRERICARGRRLEDQGAALLTPSGMAASPRAGQRPRSTSSRWPRRSIPRTRSAPTS